MNEGRMIDAHSPGKAGLIVGLAEQMGVVELFNETLSFGKGRPEDSRLSARAFARYGIQVKNINYDTTSNVMWGQYETEAGQLGAIQIDFGHSKQKRPDKKQLKLAIGTAEGIVADAQVLSGHTDDKTWNSENLDRVEDLLASLNINKDTFYYIAYSTLFSEDNLKKAAKKKIKLITRIPDHVTETTEPHQRKRRNRSLPCTK